MKLHDYQEVARDHLQSNGRAGLFLDMGLGKTASALSALTPDHLPALVVAPKRVAESVWPEEVEKWRPDLTIAVAAGSPAQRAAALASGADVVAIGRENIKDVPTLHCFRTVVMDESSSFKNAATQRWKQMVRILWRGLSLVAIRRLEGRPAGVPYRWALTGTPNPNGLLDLWPQLFLLDGGARLGATITGFRSRYFYPGKQLRTGVVTEWIPKPGAEDRIHELISDICLSMTTDGRIALPPVTVNYLNVELPAHVAKLYRTMERDLVADFGLLGEVHTAVNAAVLTNKLQQMTAGFMFHDDPEATGRGTYDRVHDVKVDAVAEIVEAAMGSPVLVFYRFRPELEALRKRFPDARLATERGVLEDWNRGEVGVMLAHPASAGHGLNLQHGGHTVVWTTPTWSLEEDMQANKRLARQGQKHPVVIHYLLARATVDRAVVSALHDKRSAHDALMSYLESAD